MKKNFTRQRITRLLSAIVLMMLFAGSLKAQEWTVYDASVLPNEFTPVFSASSGTFTAEENIIMHDVEKAGNKLLWMDIPGLADVTASQTQYYWRMNFANHSIDVSNLTVVMRVKGNPDRDLAMDLDMHYNDIRARVTIHNESKLARIRNGSGTDATLTIEPTEWNIYRFTMNATEVNLYINEEVTPSLTFTPQAATSGNKHFRFGDGDSGSTFGADIDWIIWDVTGAYAPDQGVEIPEELTSNWSVYDASVLPNELTPAFVASSGTFSADENVIIEDPDVDGNKLLWMNITNPLQTQYFWRMNFATLGIEVDNLTVVIRAKGHPNTDMALDLDMHYNDIRARISLFNEYEGESNVARIRNGTGDNVSLSVDINEWNVYRFTMNENEVKLYINENPVPELTFVPQVSVSGNKHFRFGDGDSGNTFASLIDWVIWDVTDAYAPGDGNTIPSGLIPEIEEKKFWYIYDASELPQDIKPNFITSSGTYYENESVIVVDPDNAENKLLKMDISSELQTQFFWRMNFANHNIDVDNLTVVIRAKGHPDRDMALDFDMHYNDIRARVSLLHTYNEVANVARIRNGTGENAALNISLLDWNTYRFTMTATEVNLYVNEEVTPALTFTPQTSTSNNRHFRFGDGDSGNTFGADIDWVVWDVSGAYAPGEGVAIPDPVKMLSWDTSLDEILLDDVLIDGFDSDVKSYEVILEDDVTTVSTISATATNPNAKVSIYQAFIAPGTANIKVSAENGYTEETYSVLFRYKSTDASLSAISVGAVAIEAFDPEVTEYEIVLPASTTEIPTVNGIANDDNAVVVVTQAEAIPGIASIEVTAEDGTTKLTYTVSLRLISTVATLADLLIDDVTIEGFDPEVTTYDIELSEGTTEIPVVTAVVTDENADVEIIQAEVLPGTATVTVTAEDGETILEYTINFTLATSVGITESVNINVYPNPAISFINLNLEDDMIGAKVKIIGTSGRILMQKQLNSAKEIIDISKLTQGVYIIQVEANAKQTRKIFIKQ
jgi:hypothetical protein